MPPFPATGLIPQNIRAVAVRRTVETVTGVIGVDRTGSEAMDVQATVANQRMKWLGGISAGSLVLALAMP